MSMFSLRRMPRGWSLIDKNLIIMLIRKDQTEPDHVVVSVAVVNVIHPMVFTHPITFGSSNYLRSYMQPAIVYCFKHYYNYNMNVLNKI